MKRLSVLLILGIIAGLLLPFNIPVQADDNLTIGMKRVLDNGVETTYLGKTAKGDNLWQAVIGSPQYLDDLVTPINCQWQYDLNNTRWYAKDNLFDATVKDGRVTVTYQGKRIDWQPQFEVKAIAQSEGYASLLPNDPINENYIGNTLQWNYGNGITRNLRIIEGMLIEYYTIDKLPVGDITIKANVNKDVGFVWTRPAVAWDNNSKPVDLKVVGDDLTLILDAMKAAAFPITIDPDTSFDPMVAGGYSGYKDASWATARGASTSEWETAAATKASITTGEYIDGFKINRAFVYFDTSSLPGSANITNASLELYVYGGDDDDDCEVWIRSGMPTYPGDTLLDTDYDRTHYSATDYGHVDASDNFPMSGKYNKINDITPDALKTIINVNGLTKLCLMERRDLENDQPADDDNELVYYTYEQGSGYYPKLSITYEGSATPTVTTNDATYITLTTARLNSYLDDDGGEACDARFQYSDIAGGGNASAIDVGSGAIDNDDDIASGYTRIDTTNPANANGTITTVQIWANTQMTGTKVGIFNETTNSTTYKCRSAETLGTVTAGSVQNFTGLNLTTEIGDVIGVYWSGGDIEGNYTTGVAEYHISGDTCIVDNETVYDSGAQAELSLYGFSVGDEAWINTSWVNDTYTTGDSPYAGISGLTVNTTYYFRVQASNDAGAVTGSELNFTTSAESADPTNLVAYPSSHSISLTWIKGTGTTNTLIKYQVGGYPANYTSGEQVYNGTMSTATHTGLSPGTTYYYRAWGESGGNYTANYTSAMATTYAGVGAGDVPDAPPTPSTWFSAPDYTNMADFPLYNMVNDIADDFGMPRNSFWLFGALIVVAICSLFVYRRTDSGVAGMITGGVLIVICSLAFGVPLWIIFAFGILATGIFVAVRRA